MIRPWRTWVLLLLLVGPILAYMGFGALWLWEKGWVIPVGVAWIMTGLLFSVLLARWTKEQTELLPPLDWDAPQTFSPRDRMAWDLVQAEADRGESLEMEMLTEFDVYVDTGKRLAHCLATHYQPEAVDPIQHVAIVDFLTALELASEDLNQLCRQVPGGDLITGSHWKKALKAANFVSRANEIYSVILPLFNPLTGLVRLGTRQMIQKPAWRDMQQNLLRWFYRAFVNRLGVHLIELYSGRLVIGADHYRKVTRKGVLKSLAKDHVWDATVTIGVAGRRGIGKAALVGVIESAARDSKQVETLLATGETVQRLRTAKIVEIPGYTLFDNAEDEGYRDRTSRAEAVTAGVDADILVLLIPKVPNAADLAFARDWNRWLIEHPSREPGPILIVALDIEDESSDWLVGVEPLMAALAPSVTEVISAPPFAEGEVLGRVVMPPLIGLMPRGERAALIRHLQQVSSRSKAKRLLGQLSSQGGKLWKSVSRAKSKNKT